MIDYIKTSVDRIGRFIDQKTAYENMMNTKVALKFYKKVVSGQVKHQALGPEVKAVGSYHVKTMPK